MRDIHWRWLRRVARVLNKRVELRLVSRPRRRGRLPLRAIDLRDHPQRLAAPVRVL